MYSVHKNRVDKEETNFFVVFKYRVKLCRVCIKKRVDYKETNVFCLLCANIERSYAECA
jgi:hypothetical protein